MKSTLTIWDSTAEPPDSKGKVYTWNGYKSKNSVLSLLQYVETHSERLRCKYLAWVHDLGESRIDGKRLINHLAFDDGLSYWWMTLFVEKSPWKSPSIVDAIRLFALEEIIAQQKPRKLKLVSANQDLHEVLSDLCKSLDIFCEWEKLSSKSNLKPSFKSIFNALPHPVKAGISLTLYIRDRWASRRAEKPKWYSNGRSIFFCSYFDHFDLKSAESGYFHSFYWGGVQTILNRMGCRGNWLQLFYPCLESPTTGAAISLLERFNQQRQERYCHALLDTYLSWKIISRVLINWIKLMLISWHLTGVEHKFRPQGMRISLWPLLRDDWYASVSGRTAIDNLLHIELFDTALSDLPHQEMGFYLCENQAWERALINAWRKHGHGRLIAAVVHTTVRFWDLRYYADPRTIQSSNPNPMPQPDLTALNGSVAVDAYLSMGYPKNTIIECEALRFGYLDKIRTCSSKDKRTDKIKVLILGDYLPSCTIKMLQLLEEAQPHIKIPATYTLKPHPNYRVNPEDYSSLKLEVVMDHLEKILYDFDVVYSSNKTSAAVDAYIAGLPVVVMLDNAELNYSPLRGQPDVCFVSTPEELVEALRATRQNKIRKPVKNNFFFLDPELPRWSHLLAN